MSATIDKIEKLFEGLPEDQRKANESTLKYIHYLAAVTNTDISRWNLIPAFEAEKANHLLQDKNEINKVFFEKLKKSYDRKKTAKDVKEADFKIDEVVNLKKLIDENAVRAVRDKIAAIERSAQNYEAESRNLFESGNEQLRLATVKRLECLALKDGEKTLGDKIRSEISAVIKAGTWVNPVVEGTTLWLNTKSDVVISYKNNSAGIDAEVNCGKLSARITFPDFRIYVYPYANNIILRHNGQHYWHPHVNYEGSICWGSAVPQITEWTPKAEFSKLFEILHSLLFNYNDAAPYVNIVTLKTAGVPLIPSQILADAYRHPDIKKAIKEEAKKAEEIRLKAEEERRKKLEAQAAEARRLEDERLKAVEQGMQQVAQSLDNAVAVIANPQQIEQPAEEDEKF